MKNFLAKIYLILTLDCEQSAKLTSDSFDRPLDWSERWATRVHRLICAKSRRLERQLVQMDHRMKSLLAADTRLSSEAKQQILDRLKS